MKISIFLLILTMFFCSCSNNISTNESIQNATETLNLYLVEMLETTHGNVPGASMSVISPHLDEIWSGACGFDSKTKTDTLRAEQPFRIASVTKSFVAIAILRLHEMDSLNIDNSISKFISEQHNNLLIAGGYIPENITIRHCLHHTSGLYDYAMGDPTYVDHCKINPNKKWSRTEQLKWAMDKGKPIGLPGEKYQYSDTGYIILGEIIEKYFEGDLAKGLRTLLKFDELGLANTWLETLEAARSNDDPVHRYLGREDYTEADPSSDLYGGGGLMSTTLDLAKFIHAVFSNKVFDQTTTLALMVSKANYADSYNYLNDEFYKDYRLGMWEVNVYGHKAYMHTGLWGVVLIHVPDLESSFAANYTKYRSLRPLKKAILLIKNISENKT